MRNKIRPAEPEDRNPISALEEVIFAQTAWTPRMIEEELAGPGRSYFVARDEAENILGYAGVLIVGDEADIQTIAVAESERGRGHGADLLEVLLEEARGGGAKRVFLEVRADNPVAIRLYEKNGFYELGVRKGYYQPEGVDAIVMRLDLPERVERS